MLLDTRDLISWTGTADIPVSILSLDGSNNLVINSPSGTVTFPSSPITSSTISLSTGTQVTGYGAQIDVTGGAPNISALGELQITAALSHFYTYDGTEQFRVGSAPDATQVFEMRGGSTGVGPVLYATGGTGLSVVSNFISQGDTGGFYFGNWSGPILVLQQPEAAAVNYLEIWSRESGSPVTFQLSGGDTNVNGIFNAQNTGGWFWANSANGNIAFFGNATGTTTDYMRFIPQVGPSTVNCQIASEFGGDVSIGGTGAAGGAALATTATQGFLRIPHCAGTPTGTPAIADNYTAIVFDTTDSKLYAYVGGAWKAATFS